MIQMKEALARILIPAMILSMLPFAAAANPEPVEDVAVIAEIPAPAQTVGRIETAPAEPVAVKADLQGGETQDDSIAAYQPEYGEEGQPVTFGEAFTQWKENGSRGTVKLLSDVTAKVLDATASGFGREVSCRTPDGESFAAYVSILLGEESGGGSLTLDLNGYTLCGGAIPFGTDVGLNDFDLTIVNGTVAGGTMALCLHGTGVRMKLDSVCLTVGDGAFCDVLDRRYDNSCATVTNCTLSSENGSNIWLSAQPCSAADHTLLYYVKDCAIRSGGADGSVFTQVREDGCTADRTYTIIVDGDNTVSTENAVGNWLVSSASGTDQWAHVLSGVTASGPENGVITVTTDFSTGLLTEDGASAELNAGEMTLCFKNVSSALTYAELFGRNASYETILTLTGAATETAQLGNAPVQSAFMLNLNGQSIPKAGLIRMANGTKGSQTTVTMSAEAAGSAKLFAGIPALRYSDGDEFIFRYGSFFTNYSLNLAESVSINLYTDSENGDPDAVYYRHGGEEYTVAVPGDVHDWLIASLTAKQMCEEIDAYAVKMAGATTVIDYRSGFSVKGYTAQNPAAYCDANTQAHLADALNAVLETMLIYGKYAEKYFSQDYTELTAEEMSFIGVTEVPETDTSNLVHSERVVLGMGDHTVDSTVESGYWGSTVVLADSICLKFHFCGKEFEGAEATVDGEPAAIENEENSNTFKYVNALISARQFDVPITVTITGAGLEVLGSVKDSLEAYTARIEEISGAYRLAQAMRAYGADAKRYYDAKKS